MNREEAKIILLTYRHGIDDAADAEVVAALQLAQLDPDLGRWWEQHRARQLVLRDKFRQIPVPEGLKEQIISEHAANQRRPALQPNRALIAVLMMSIILFVVFTFVWQPSPKPDYSLLKLQTQMCNVALSNYGMELFTNGAPAIRQHLLEREAPADFALTQPLQHTTLTGCAVEGWRDKKVSLICFHSGETTDDPKSSDLWLFVVDRKSVPDNIDGPRPKFNRVNQLVFATWVDGEKLYLLAKRGDVQSLAKFL